MLKFDRINAHLANERTWLAWIRTTFSLLSCGLTLQNYANDSSSGTWHWWLFAVGCATIVSMDFTYMTGWIRYGKVKEILQQNKVSTSTAVQALVSFVAENTIRCATPPRRLQSPPNPSAPPLSPTIPGGSWAQNGPPEAQVPDFPRLCYALYRRSCVLDGWLRRLFTPVAPARAPAW